MGLGLGASIVLALVTALFGVGATWLGNRANNSRLTGSQQEQNTYNSMEAQYQRDWASEESATSRAFNAEQAQIDRDFQAEQAQNQMDFQERMDNTVYQRRVADMKAAGVNPALAVGGISVGSTSGAAGSGSMASSSPASGASASGSAQQFPISMSDMMQSGLMSKNMALLDSQIQQNDAKTMRDMAEAGLLGEQRIGQSLANKWFEPMKQAELNNLKDVLNNNRVERALKRSNISVNEAEEALTVVQTAIAHADAATRDQLNRASIRMTLSQASLNTALSSESTKRLELIDAEINELYQRAIMESLQGGMYSANELESMERAGLIRVQAEGESLENQQKSYSVQHKKLNYWLGVAGTTAGVISSFAPAAIGLSAVGRMGKKIFGSNYVPSRGSSYSGKPFNAYYSQGSDLLTNYVQSW